MAGHAQADASQAHPGDDPVGSTAQRVATAVRSVAGVTDLYSGMFGEIATYMPGGRVGGVTLDDSRGTVHVVVDISQDLRAVASEVARVASDVAQVPIDVSVEDVSLVEDGNAAEDVSAAELDGRTPEQQRKNDE